MITRAVGIVLAALSVHPLLLPAQRSPAAASCEPATLFSSTPCRSFVYQATTRSGSLEARAQVVFPDSGAVGYAVVIVGGGLIGHVAFTTEIWRGMCVRLRCALVHFDVEPAEPPSSAAEDPGRNAARGSGDALLALLDSLANRTGHPELSLARLALFGFSATGSFALTFAIQHPARTLTAVRYHSHLRGLAMDTVALTRTPVLLIASTGDSSAGVEDTRTLWQRGQSLAPRWAFAVEAGRAHTSLDSWWEASDLIWHWIGTLGRNASPVDRDHGWYGDPRTRQIGRATAARVGDTSWFPDSVTAESWRRLSRSFP